MFAKPLIGNLDLFGVDLKDVVAIPGFYEKTLNEETKTRHALHKAAVVMIDATAISPRCLCGILLQASLDRGQSLSPARGSVSVVVRNTVSSGLAANG